MSFFPKGVGGKSKCLKIRASVENIVHALLRVREMSSRLSEIFNSAIEEEEDELEMISNQNIVKDIEVVLNPPDNQNSGPPMSEGNSVILLFKCNHCVLHPGIGNT